MMRGQPPLVANTDTINYYANTAGIESAIYKVM